MTTFLVYGKDSTGKSSQLKSLCEASEVPILISMELKNRKLYGLDSSGKPTDSTPFEVVEPLVLEPAPSYKTVQIETFNAMGMVVQRITNNQDASGNDKEYKTVVIDGISDFPRMAEKVIIKKLKEKWPDTTAIGKENLAAWSARNDLAALPLEALAAWAEVSCANVFFTTLMTPEYLNGNKSGYKIDIQDRIRDKVCDVRINLSKDGRGYIARFEKVPDWAERGAEEVVLSRGGLFVELSKRRLL